jgi:gas vesicle protein
MSTEDRSHGRGGQVSTLFLATVLGVGVGLLAAPRPGRDTRRALRKRLATATHDIGEGLEELEQRSRPARRAMKARAEQLRERGRKKYEEALDDLEDYEGELEDDDDEEGEEDSGGFGTVLAMGAGLAAAAFLLTSERAAPARERVREAAATVRDEAEARWDRFQSRRGNGHPTTESGTRIDPADSAPQAS